MKTLFASSSLPLHLARGVLGVLLFAAALHVAPTSAALSVILGLGALLAFRGCPMCWTLGLVETWMTRAKKQG